MSDDKSTPAQKNDAAVRWGKEARDQLGYVLNLFFTLTIAAIGYCFILLRDRTSARGKPAKLCMVASRAVLGLSAVAGFCCVIVRLHDFRGTARRARGHPEAPSREYMRALDDWILVLLELHLATFAIGVATLAIALVLTYGGKLA